VIIHLIYWVLSWCLLNFFLWSSADPQAFLSLRFGYNGSSISPNKPFCAEEIFHWIHHWHFPPKNVSCNVDALFQQLVMRKITTVLACMSKVVGNNDDFLLCKQQYVRRRLKVNAQKGSETIVLFKVTSSKANILVQPPLVCYCKVTYSSTHLSLSVLAFYFRWKVWLFKRNLWVTLMRCVSLHSGTVHKLLNWSIYIYSGSTPT